MFALKQYHVRSLLRISFVQVSSFNSRNELSNAQFHTSAVDNKKVSFKLSDIGEGIREVAIKEWFVKVGSEVAQFQDVCEVQSDKASVTITSRYDGVITKLHYDIDDVALVGEPLVDLEVQDADDPVKSPIAPIKVADVKSILAIPKIRKYAKESNVDLNKVHGTGKNNRIIQSDINKYLSKAPESKESLSRDRIEPIKGFTKAMVKTMTQSLKIPHFVYSDEIVMTQLVRLRTDIKDHALKNNYRITYMPFFIKAASKALSQYPLLNSSVDDKCENIIFKNKHNIGVAMDTANGLVVPNIKDVENKTIFEVTKELMRLQELGAKSALSTDDLTGGTFTLSNIGIIGGTYTKPVILPPEVVIGAIGKTQVLPRFNTQGTVVAEHILNVSWSADHRVVDGVTMAKFSNLWKHYLENPLLLLNLPL